MPTILLEQIIDILMGWKDSFFTWANSIGDKIASIKTNTDSLPDIKDNTDDIKDNTAAVITPISNINTNVTSISSDTASIRTDTGIIKNNAQAIATSSGAAAAFAEDVANNTLEVKNKVTTIASDTTQMRANTNEIKSGVDEISENLKTLFLASLITEDSYGGFANFDTDLIDYLQREIISIPSDANGINNLNIVHCGVNIASNNPGAGYLDAYYLNSLNNPQQATVNPQNWFVTEYTPCPDKLFISCDTVGNNPSICFYDSDYNFISGESYFGRTAFAPTIPTNAVYFRASINRITNMILSVSNTYIPYEDYISSRYSIAFSSPITDGAEVDLLSGIVKINTSPVTYDFITPLAIRTFKGVNNIYSDIGDVSVTFRETLKHYLEKQQ